MSRTYRNWVLYSDYPPPTIFLKCNRISNVQTEFYPSVNQILTINFKDLKLCKLFFQVGCCGADGANDYLSLQQPLPSQCRDTVTGNPFYHGCVDELTWFFEEKTAWVVGLAMTVCFVHVSEREGGRNRLFRTEGVIKQFRINFPAAKETSRFPLVVPTLPD